MLHVFYFSFRWGPFVHFLGIIQWNSTRRDHPGNPGGVFGSGPVSFTTNMRANKPLGTTNMDSNFFVFLFLFF